MNFYFNRPDVYFVCWSRMILTQKEILSVLQVCYLKTSHTRNYDRYMYLDHKIRTAFLHQFPFEQQENRFS